MFIERIPAFMRRLMPHGIFRLYNKRASEKVVYLTFDDGPIPEATPEILDILDRYDIKATFFMVGDNARRYSYLYEEVKRRGHEVGNHTMHHLQGMRTKRRRYLRDVLEAHKYIDSNLFRPPHGWLWRSQARALSKRYRLVMYDLVTRDYSCRLNAEEVVQNVKRYTRPGSIIVFHDSLKSIEKLRTALPESIEWLRSQGYSFGDLKRTLEKNK